MIIEQMYTSWFCRF